MSKYLIKKAEVLDPQSSWHNKKVDIQIEEGQITKIELSQKSSELAESIQIIEANHSYISPGWVDMQVHLSDPGFEYKETLTELSLAALSGGYTTILCYPNTQPPIDNSQFIQSLNGRSQNMATEFIFCGCVSEKGEGKELAEMFDMHSVGAGAFTDGSHPVQSSGVVMRALQYLKAFDGLFIHCPIDMSLVPDGQMNEGEQSTLLGMKGIPEIAETLALSRDLQLLEYTSGKIHFQPLSSPEAIELVAKAKQSNDSISLGTSVFYFVLEDSRLNEFDSVYKVMPPLRSNLQLKALQKALKEGKIDVLTSGHRAQSIEEKRLAFEQASPGMLGLQTNFAIANTYLIQKNVIDLVDWIHLSAINPRKILGLAPVSIEENAAANLTLFNPKEKWQLSPSDIPSRSKNSPFIGESLTGKVIGTFCKGQFFDKR